MKGGSPSSPFPLPPTPNFRLRGEIGGGEMSGGRERRGHGRLHGRRQVPSLACGCSRETLGGRCGFDPESVAASSTAKSLASASPPRPLSADASAAKPRGPLVPMECGQSGVGARVFGEVWLFRPCSRSSYPRLGDQCFIPEASIVLSPPACLSTANSISCSRPPRLRKDVGAHRRGPLGGAPQPRMPRVGGKEFLERQRAPTRRLAPLS